MVTQFKYMLRRPLLALGSLAVLLSTTTAIAQASENITLSAPSNEVSTEGNIVGSFSLANIANTDRFGNLCAGFGDTNPDHILTLESDFPSLTITVDSGKDTTLLIQGPDDNSIYCGQDISRSNLDAQVSADNLRAGAYRIWVGAHQQGERFGYTLTVK